MEMEFQLLDCDYILLENTPIIRLFGKTENNKTVCAFFRGYYPYFYILPKRNFENQIIEFIKKKFPDLIAKIEIVEKFKPIHYQPAKTVMLKVMLNDPSRVPEVREAVEKEKIAEKIYEADILFRYRFMADYELSGLKWVKVQGRPTKTDIVKTDIKIEIDKFVEHEKTRNVDLKYLSIDIETISSEGVPDPKKHMIGMISLAFEPSLNKLKTLTLVAKNIPKISENVKSFSSEKEMLKEFLKILDSYDPDIIVGYNINNFDFPYLLTRLKENDLSTLIGRCNQKPAQSRKFGIHYKNTSVSRIIVDVYELIKEAIQKSNLRLKRLGLNDVSKELLNDQKIDISHGEIYDYWNGTDTQIKRLVEYAEKDAKLVLDLLEKTKFLDKFIELSKVSGLLFQDCLDGGEAQRVENLLLREFNKNDFVLPCKPQEKSDLENNIQELKGALVLEPILGLHTDPIVYLDFKSMYPSIFIAYNICPTTFVTGNIPNISIIKTPYNTTFISKEVREGVIPTILKNLIKERDNTRSNMKKTSDENTKRLLEAKQLALKIMANAFYGYTGYIRARLYMMDIANTITGCGRYLINKTKEIVELNTPHKVVYGDTDSIMVKINAENLDKAYEIGKDVETLVNIELTGIVEIKIEKVFKTLLILSKKRYAGLSFEKVGGEWKEETVMKGVETVRRDWCDLTTKTSYDVFNILLKEQNVKKAFAYVKEVLTKLEKNEILADELVITKSISKSISSYKGIQPHVELVKKLRKRNGTAPSVGDRVSFVIVKGTQLLSNRSEDPEYVKKNKIPIDSKYYIENQILPPLERVFEVIGINKSELVGGGRQTFLKELFKNNNQDIREITLKDSLNNFEKFICHKCNKFYRRVSLSGKCLDCQGEILFFNRKEKSRIVDLSLATDTV